MHAVVMLYGDVMWLNHFIEEWRHLKLPMKMTRGEDVLQHYITCQVRMLPCGLYEIVFPKEHADAVLTTLNFDKKPPYNLDKSVMGFKPFNFLKKYLNIEEIPEFKTDRKIPMVLNDVSIIPIGVRYDGEITEPEGMPFAGYVHEAI